MRVQWHKYGILVVLALLLCLPLLAAGPQAKTSKGLVMTDAAGHNVTPETVGLNVQSHPAMGQPVMYAPRDEAQTWWPYAEKISDNTSTSTAIEEMGESQINVNGVVMLDTRNEATELNSAPKDLIIPENEQLSLPEGYYLVKIEGRTRSTEQVDQLTAAGAVLGEYLPINTYIAAIPFDKLAAVKSLPFVTYCGDYHPLYKICPRIGKVPVPVEMMFEKTWRFEVILHKGADLKAVIDALAERSIFVKENDINVNEYSNTIYVDMDPAGVVDIAKIPGVKWIDEYAYPHLMASSSSPSVVPMLLQNNGTWTTSTAAGWKLWNAGIDGNASGTAQIVTMQDTGLNYWMEHFSEYGSGTAPAPSASHRKVIGYGNDGGGGDLCVLAYTGADGGHGTWTSQHAVGSISNQTSPLDTTHTPNNYYDVGIARDAKLYFQDIGNSAGNLTGPTNMAASITGAIAKGSYIQNNSWGTSSNSYDTNASAVDSALYSNPNMVVTVSSGNSGTSGGSTIGSPSTAKNCICVGGVGGSAVNQLFMDCTWDGTTTCGGTNDLGSSRGPVATSNRIKPDICGIMAFDASVGGENMAGNRPHAMCSPNTGAIYWDYTTSSGYGGTSFASPQIAGLAALVRDYFIAGYYPSGAKVPANTVTPSGSLVKAVLLASGEPLTATSAPSTVTGGATRYSNWQGYGRANLSGVLRIGGSAPYIWVKNDKNLAAGGTDTFTYNIKNNDMPLRVMMVYYDAAGNTIQKDLNLEVTIGANTYLGNVFTSGWSTTGGTADATNNTEGVFLQAPALPSSGTVTVRVIGFSNPSGQNYSLVVSGNVFDDATQVNLDQAIYNCLDTVGIAVTHMTGSSPVSVTMRSYNSSSTLIDTETVSCTGASGYFNGSIPTWGTVGTSGDGSLYVLDGGHITADYYDGSAHYYYTSNISCQLAMNDGGYIIEGGCDNYFSAFDDSITGPMYASGVNEYYNSYMDAGEYTAYTFGFTNKQGVDLTDVHVALSFSGAGASKMTVYNSPVDVGAVPFDYLGGAAFQVYTDPSTTGLTDVNMNFAITSPADGYTTPLTITQVQHLQTNDTISRLNYCENFTGSLGSYYEAAYTSIGAVANPWTQIADTTIKGENRTTGLCAAAANGAAVTAASGGNFATDAFGFLTRYAQPANRGNAVNGQPWYYVMKAHESYGSMETASNTSGVWGLFYHPTWDNTIAPTADDIDTVFPWTLAYYLHTAVLAGYTMTGSWDWETANTGTPDDFAAGPPNQQQITISDSAFPATSTSYFSWATCHADLAWFSSADAATHADIAIDNDMLIYDQFYATAQAGASCGSAQPGQVSLDKYVYYGCPSDTIAVSVLDGNATSPITVTITSGQTGDSEAVTLTGTAPYFTGSLPISTKNGIGNNSGMLYVGIADSLTATYTDANPATSVTTYASTSCPGGDVVFTSYLQTYDNGDNDGYADNNESVYGKVTITNNMTTDLTNAKVYIFSADSDIACVYDNNMSFGTVTAGTSQQSTDVFKFKVSSATACSNWQNPPNAKFDVIITGDDFYGSATPQNFMMDLDLDSYVGSGYTYNQNFSTDPSWVTGTTPDDDGGSCASQSYTNTFAYRPDGHAAGNACYGAWTGTGGTMTATGPGYGTYDSSTLYSPVFKANGNVGIYFDTAFHVMATYHGAKVQSKVGAGAWTNLNFTTPTQGTTTTSTQYCMPLGSGNTCWLGATGTNWTTTSTSTVTATAGQDIQFRWRLGSDSSAYATGGFAVDNVYVTNLQQTVQCEPTRNTGLPDTCIPAPVIIYSTHGTFTEVTGNGDAYFDKGEKWSVNVTVKNDGNLTVNNVQATLTGNEITVCSVGTFGTMAPEATANFTYSFVISPTFSTCGGAITFNLVTKTSTEATPAGADENGVFTIAHVGTPGAGTATEIVIQPSFEDSYVNEQSTATNYGTATTMNVQRRLTRNHRTLVTFDLSGIPAGSTINTAQLELYATAAAGTAQTLDCHYVTSTWTEAAVTWATIPSYNATVTSSISGGTTTGWKTWTGLGPTVSSWFTGSLPNYGLLVKCNAETGTTTYTYTFASSENATTANRPILRVNYTPITYTCSYTGSGTCGACTNPSTPTISSVTDVSACAQSGVTITFTAGSPSTSNALLVDSSEVATGITSPYVYNPGDTTSHNYQVRTYNTASCHTDSTVTAGTDVNSGVGAPTISSVTDVDACAQSGVTITWGSVSGATGYDLLIDGTTPVTTVTSPYVYNPGNTTTHGYQVRAKNASCTGTYSTSVNGTDANNAVGAPTISSVTDVDACAQSGVTITWGSVSGATGYDLLVDGTTPVLSVTSPYVYNPGNTTIHGYQVRAKNASCTGSYSTSVNGTDANNAVGAPTISSVTDVDACAQSGVTVTWGSVSGATGYDLLVDGTTPVLSVTSPYVYNPGNTTVHGYQVRAKNASCTGSYSTSVNGTDANNGVGAPTISSVTDVDACAQSGVTITWGAVSGATGYDLYVDGSTLVTTVTSPYVYNPGNTTVHGYQVRAKNASCTGSYSTSVNGTDANNAVGAPTISSVTDVDACAQSGVTITWGAVSGATGYDLYVDATTLVTSVTSPYVYNPGNTTVHGYQVRAKNASCTGSYSTSVNGTDVNNGLAAASITSVVDADACAQSGVTITWGAVSGATAYDLYVDSTTIVNGVTSPYLRNPGDTSSHNYQIRAVNASCTGAWSAIVAGTDANNGLAAASITSVVDVSACAQSGVTITWGAVSGATAYDLYVDSTTIVNGVTSPYLRNPGDTSSHNYQIRAVNASCTGAWSAIVAGTDANGQPSTPVISSVVDNSALLCDGVVITFTTGAPATQHDLYIGAVLVQANITSPYLYVPGDSLAHTYIVRAVNGTCYADSVGVAGTDLCGSPCAAPSAEVTDDKPPVGDKTQFTWTAIAADHVKVVRGIQGNLAALETSAEDFTCYASALTTSVNISGDDPSGVTGKCYYYLIAGYNCSDSSQYVGPYGLGKGAVQRTVNQVAGSPCTP